MTRNIKCEERIQIFKIIILKYMKLFEYHELNNDG